MIGFCQASSMSIFDLAAQMERSHESSALCTVVKIKGSTPRKPGAKMIVIDDDNPYGRILGSVGGGAIEHLIRKKAIDAIRSNEAQLMTTSLRNELGMCCGGEMTVFIEPIVTRSDLICFGAGHIVQAICPILSSLGFFMHVVDHRTELLKSEALFCAKSHLTDPSCFAMDDMPFNKNTYVLIATHDHGLDQSIAEGMIKRPFAYAAMVGSLRKAKMMKKRLLAKGFSLSQINRIFCPAGLNINAITPEEIAISIAAQIIMVKNETLKDRLSDRCSWPKQTHGVS